MDQLRQNKDAMVKNQRTTMASYSKRYLLFIVSLRGGLTGWALGRGEAYQDPELQDEIESRELYDLLEHQVAPLFYRRGADGLPREWLALMKRAMQSSCPVFNSNRMVHEYTQRFYLPAAEAFERLAAEGAERAKKLARWKAWLRENWAGVEIVQAVADMSAELKVGDSLQLRAWVKLAPLSPQDVSVEAFFGQVNSERRISNAEVVRLSHSHQENDGAHLFTGAIPCRTSGQSGYAMRILPHHPDLANPFDLGLIRWEENR